MTGFITFDLGSKGTIINGINDASQIVGSYIDDIFGAPGHGFVYLGIVGANLDAPVIGGGVSSSTTAYGINNALTVVGTYEESGFVTNSSLWRQGNYTEFADPLSVGGTSQGGFSTAHGINDAGQIVGAYLVSDGNSVHGF